MSRFRIAQAESGYRIEELVERGWQPLGVRYRSKDEAEEYQRVLEASFRHGAEAWKKRKKKP
jgi:hypothetical protein